MSQRTRYRLLTSLVAIYLMFFAAAAVQLGAAEASWQAGWARVVITPPQPMWMAGYASRDHAAEGKLADLGAKALVLEDARGRQAVLVTVDLIGIDRDLAGRVCRTLAQRHPLDRRQIAFCCSHTHTGPALKRNLSPLHYLIVDRKQQELIEQYTTELETKLVQVVEQALAVRQPVQLAWGSGTASFAVNRRNNRPEDKVPELRAAGQLKGPEDHDVPVLAVRDAAGWLRAVVFGYACHATVLSSYQWSGDYPGFAQQELEQAHPGCQAMFWAGCGADQNPLPRRTVELAQSYGRQLAEAVDQVLEQPLTAVAPQLHTAFREIDLPLAALPTREQIEQDTQSADRYVAARAQLLRSEWEQGRPPQPTYPYAVQTWRLGSDVQFVILGGEVVVDYALRLKSELRGRKTWVAGYANDVMAYIASRRVLAEGGYEGGGAMVYYGLPAAWAPESEDLIVREVQRQLAEDGRSR
jgi:hypothetical protein